ARTPNPCIECNRHIKFDRLLERATRLGFDALATGHHARIVAIGTGHELRRGADPEKDQSYVLSMLGQRELARVLLPIGEMTKRGVRARATELGLRTAAKPDSQDVCFIRSDEGRARFLGDRLALHPARVVDASSGEQVGTVDALELVTVGQRRGFAHGADGSRRYVSSVDPTKRTVFVGTSAQVAAHSIALVPSSVTWTEHGLSGGDRAVAQTSAHGSPSPCTFTDGDRARLDFDEPIRPVAPGQTVALYAAADPDRVVGSGTAA
ncbi:MAG: tRNA methyl transferase PRC-barrel domain-containing protein, partial [Acidimicrobiales bacterium]